ncbi:MAG: flagellar protein FliS [Bryobacterales bacterium]|nr:flagellar protein FliS [Bryobacterales bacterium]
MTNTLSAYLEQEILSAEPLQLVCMLYQAAITEVREARRHLATNDISARCAAISKACDLIGELLTSLDMAAGGELAQRLGSLYSYLLARLLEANLKKADEPLAEVLGLLTTLNEAWQAAAAETHREVASQPSPHQAHFLQEQTPDSAAHSWSF